MPLRTLSASSPSVTIGQLMPSIPHSIRRSTPQPYRQISYRSVGSARSVKGASSRSSTWRPAELAITDTMRSATPLDFVEGDARLFLLHNQAHTSHAPAQPRQANVRVLPSEPGIRLHVSESVADGVNVDFDVYREDRVGLQRTRLARCLKLLGSGLWRGFTRLLVQTNRVGPDEWMCRYEVPDYVTHSSPKDAHEQYFRDQRHEQYFRDQRRRITMDQALNARAMVTRFGLATGHRRATVQPQWCSPRRRRRSLHRPAGLAPRRRLGLDSSCTSTSTIGQHSRRPPRRQSGVRHDGLTPADAHVAEVHDFFTGIESISYETWVSLTDSRQTNSSRRRKSPALAVRCRLTRAVA